MKTLFSLMITLQILLAPLSFAQGDAKGNGGGEDGVFIAIRDEIGKWLEANLLLGKLEEKLELKGLSGTELYEKYKEGVVAVGTRVVFTSDRIFMGQSEKICKNEPALARIICNTELWNQTRGDTRYLIVFHEYLGLVGVESNTGELSTYPISSKLLPYVKASESFELGMERNEEIVYVQLPTPQYHCRNIYKELTDKTWGRFARRGAIVAGLGLVGVFIHPVIFVAGVAKFGVDIVWVNKQDKSRRIFDYLDAAHYGTDLLIKKFNFEAKHGFDFRVNKDLYAKNEERKAQGLPPFTREQYLYLSGQRFVPVKAEFFRSSLDDLSDEIYKKRKVRVSRDRIESTIRAGLQSDQFCPNGKPIQYRKFLKLFN